MAAHVTTRSGEGYKVHAGNGTSGVVLDMSTADGGGGDGLEPHETLLAALGACTTMTLLSYARRKSWPLDGVDVDLTHEKAPASAGDAPARIEVRIGLRGALDAEQRARLMEIAKKCPVYRTLTSPLAIVESAAPAAT